MITDELRKYVQSWRETPNLMDDLDAGDIDGLLGDFEHIADRIDAKHEEALGSKVARAISVGEDGTEFVSMPAKELSECYIELPKDADGEYVRVGDVLEGTLGQRHKVDVLELHKSGEWTAGEYGSGDHLQMLDGWHVVKPPTVEDVLVAMLEQAVGYSDAHTSVALNTIAEYAAKLQLKEDE